MKWIADIIISIAKLLSKRAINTYFTPQRAMEHRLSDTTRWRKYRTKAQKTPGKGDDAIAEYLRIRLNIQTDNQPPAA